MPSAPPVETWLTPPVETPPTSAAEIYPTYRTSPLPDKPKAKRRRRKLLGGVARRRLLTVLAVLGVLLTLLLVAYITESNGVDRIHGFGNTCLLVHNGWHFHVQCGAH
jgi:hypothetical protein